jgi:putative PIN family toxin of toxin-antitoxin system
VLDTSVVLSALVFTRGPTTQLRAAWQAGRMCPLVSAATVRELVRGLACPKFGLDRSAQQELLADYLPCAETVGIPEPPPSVPDCRDALDVPFLLLAVAGQAAALVTGDGDLLSVASVGRCVIVTPAAFVSSRLLPARAPG